jgi:hypothetical protein
MSARPDPPPPDARRPISPGYLVAAGAALGALNAAGGVLPHSSLTWCVAHPQRLAPALHVALAIAAPIGLALGAAAALGAAPASRAGRIARALAAPWPWTALLVLLTALVPNTVPYGDAVRFYRFVPGATGPEANAPLSFEAHRLLAALFPNHLVGAFSSLSLLGGLLAIPALFRLASALFPTPGESDRRALFLLGMGGTAAWQIFLGYVEHYHVQLALVTWGLAFALEGRAGRGALLVGLASAWNLSAAWLLPAVVLAAPGRARGAAGAAALALAPIALTLALVTALYGPAAVAASYAGGFHPFATPNAGFVPLGDLLSSEHALFVANEALLVSPIAVALAPALLAAWLRRRPPLAGFRSLALAGSLLFFLLWHPRLGFSRDWDLFAWPLFVTQALALEAALRAEPAPARATSWLPLVACGQAVALLYVLSNSRLGR